MEYIFSFMGLEIALSGEKVDLLQYCEDYFKNYFECTKSDRAQKNVILDVKIREPIFDKRNYTLLKEWQFPFDIYYHNNERELIVTNLKENDKRNLMRLMRELFIYNILFFKECSFFHSACVANDDFSIAIIGDKFAGKTTMCLNLLNSGWDFVSNDKLILSKNDEKELICWGLPIALGIRDGTMPLYFDKLQNIERDIDDNRYYLTPNQLIERFNVKVANGRKLKMFLIPKFSPHAKEIRLERLSPDKALPILKKQYLEAFNDDNRILGVNQIKSEEKFIEEIQEIPAFEVTINSELNYKLNNAIMNIIR